MEIGEFLANDFADPDSYGQYTIKTHSEKVSMAISVGGKANCHPYIDLQEDSSIYLVTEKYRLAAVADAHSGAKAGILMITTIRENAKVLLENISKTNKLATLQKWMCEYIFPVSHNLAYENQSHPIGKKSRTQLTVVVVSETEVYYAQFGDTRSYILTKNEDKELSPVVKRRSLGFLMTEADFLESLKLGVRSWQSDDEAIIICSDGFPEASYPEYDANIVTSWARPFQTAENICQNMMTKAIDLGACDNLSIISLIK